MINSTDYCLVISTVDTPERARQLANRILQEKLGACVQLSGITSTYRWRGELREDEEVLIRIKTRRALYPDLQDLIVREHPYDVPQVVQVPIDNGLRSYLQWIGENTRSK